MQMDITCKDRDLNQKTKVLVALNSVLDSTQHQKLAIQVRVPSDIYTGQCIWDFASHPPSWTVCSLAAFVAFNQEHAPSTSLASPKA